MLDPIITIEEGKLQGKVQKDARGGKYYSFQGIPYGKPPVGEFRFKAPLPVDKWNGILDATKEGNDCIQKNFITSTAEGSEDCLNLNVYTPQLPLENRPTNAKLRLKPVMVWIHGGAFVSGSNKCDKYGPQFLITDDVVLVTINYRLGLLGFLTLDDPSLGVPGNAGFKDMVLALKWVQKNIINFMGDPNNVTIFGESAGAVSVHFLVLSPMAKGLFHKAICQSGCALNGWAYCHNVAPMIAEDMGINFKNEKDLLKHLQNVSAEKVLKTQIGIDKQTVHANKSRYVGVVVEKPSNEPAFFSLHPLEILLSGDYNKIPIMMGYNSGDGMVIDALVAKDMNYIYWENKEHNVPGLLGLKMGSSLSKILGEKIVKFYFGEGKISRETHLQNLYDITTDNSFLKGILSSVKCHSRDSSAPTYLYKMDIETDLNLYKNFMGIESPGVCHADNIGYLFHTSITPAIEAGSMEDISQRRFGRLWTNFAKYGNPTPLRDPLLETWWEPVTNNTKVPYLEITEELKIHYNPEPERMKFWDDVYSFGSLTSKL